MSCSGRLGHSLAPCFPRTPIMSDRLLQQNILDVSHPSIVVQTIQEIELNDEILSKLVTDATRAVGISASYTQKNKLAVLALCTSANVLIITFRNTVNDAVAKARQLLQDRVLCSPSRQIYAFDIGPVALSLFLDRDLRLVNGVDFQSACSAAQNRDPVKAIEFAIASTSIRLHSPDNVRSVFNDNAWIWDTSDRRSERVLALRAWIAVYLSSVNGDMEDRVRQVPRVNTSVVPDAVRRRSASQTSSNEVLTNINQELHVLAQQVRGDQRLDSQKATVTAHDFKSVQIHHSNTKLRVELSRFQTRVLQASLNQQLYLKLRDRAGATYTIPGRTTHTKGPVIWIAIQQPYSLHEKTVTELFTAGQDGGTASDRFKAADILAALQGKLNLFDNPFMRTIWPKPDSLAVWPESFTSPPPPPLVIAPNILINESQQEAVLHMLSLDNDKRITLIQGPPGTGKTTVIATYVVSATRADRGGIWLVAQSNVAVKNIAEKLIKINFYKWKLLVSKDFHLGWHEHLYQRVSRNIIRSDEFKTAAKELQGCQVILCTLSMLSHFLISNFTSQIPIQTLVVDEASQIKVSDYLHPLKTFHSIRKLCFIGDDKQLPPYGQEQIETIQSIFEVSHLRSSALFLDIQ
ncbi:hypothetical protein K474DRAFT_811260 [Panus rudis PR-1116 ss-1]|nr:hypothetical protein K474DRAFT_811260 [Panus rudis PR-1116 ss-1]